MSFVSGICQRNRRYAESKGISLVYGYSEESIEMDFVPDLIVRIVQNLLANALKFSDKGTEVRVAVSRKRQAELTERLRHLEQIWEEYDVYDTPHR